MNAKVVVNLKVAAVKKRTAWLLALEKRGRRQKRLVEIAMNRLEGDPNTQLPMHDILGIRLGLLALANSSPNLVDVQARARWVIHWMIAFCFEQGYDVEDAASENGLLAIEAVAVVAATARQPRANQPNARNSVLYTPNGDRITQQWQDVYLTANKFIGALSELAR